MAGKPIDVNTDGFVWMAGPMESRGKHPQRSSTTSEHTRALELRVAKLEQERSRWEQERAAWVRAGTSRSTELVLSLPSIRAGLTGLARRVATAALRALRQRLPV